MKDLYVIKIGGKLIDEPVGYSSFIKNVTALKGHKILVHGGGNIASEMCQNLKVPVHQVEGRRVTDANTLDIITMAYAGKINKTLVARLQSQGCNALGLTGADGNSIKSVMRDKNPIDYGYVGDPIAINIDLIQVLLHQGITPVFSAITHDGAGQLLNTNADTIAAVVSSAFAKAYKTSLYYCFEKPGVLLDINDEASLIEMITQSSYEQLKKKNVIAGGMLPKLHNCYQALQSGVGSVKIGLPDMILNTVKHTTLSI